MGPRTRGQGTVFPSRALSLFSRGGSGPCSTWPLGVGVPGTAAPAQGLTGSQIQGTLRGLRWAPSPTVSAAAEGLALPLPGSRRPTYLGH